MDVTTRSVSKKNRNGWSCMGTLNPKSRLKLGGGPIGTGSYTVTVKLKRSIPIQAKSEMHL